MAYLHDSKGFTLVEVFLALCIFMLGLVPFVKLQLSTIDSNLAANQVTEATNLAKSKMEELLGMKYQDLISATITSNKVDNYTVSWARTLDSPIASTTTLSVTVSWTDTENRGRSVSLTSVKGM